MAKYNVGDVLEITETFFLEGAQYKAGQKYTVEDIFDEGKFYELEDKDNGICFHNTPSKVDAHSGFRKVETKVVFKVGDKVRLLECAHGNPDFAFSWGTEEGFEKNFGYRYDLAEPFVVRVEIDYAGEVGISQDELNSYVLAEFLVPWVEEEEKPAEYMELGKMYQSTSNDFFYTPTAFDFESERVEFDFRSEVDSFVGTSHRYFYSIEEEFGVLPPVKPENESEQALEELRVKLQAVGEVKSENTLAEAVSRVEADPWLSAAPKPETVSVDALREAWDYVDHEYPDIEKLIKLAKRLS